MKKLLSFLLVLMMLLSCSMTALAVNDDREYFFELTVNGKDTVEVSTGDVITVTFHLNRTDSNDPYTMYAMQNEIRYDSTFFRLVEGSEMISSGISTTDISLRDQYREFYMNFLSLAGGELWEARRLVGSFQLEVIATSGVTKITNEDFLVSTSDGMDQYKATAGDITVILTTECTVKFQSNGGTPVEDITVIYGETIPKPEDPVREGYVLEGWYQDIDLQKPWDFEKDTAAGNMTLYAKWQKAQAPVEDPGTDDNGVNWWLILIGLGLIGLLLILLILLLARKTVKFETNCAEKIKSQRVKKGNLIPKPNDPKRMGQTFVGWYRDEAGMIPWIFDTDKVEENLTLYAKWE